MNRTPSKDSDQPGHPPNLILVFTVHLKKPWVHKSFCWLCHAAAHIVSTLHGQINNCGSGNISEPVDHWSCIAHLIAEDMFKSAVIEEKTFKHSPWAGADNPLGPKF